MGRRTLVLAWCCVGLLAVALRVPDLASRPFHTDEATNAVLLQSLGEGRYRYLGHDHHGPVLYYLAAAWLWPQGLTTMGAWTESHLRVVSVAAGLVVTLLPLGLRAQLGEFGAWTAGLLSACCAPLVYYSGIFIHETVLLVWLGSFVVCFWRTRTEGQWRWALGAGVAAGLALATKETAAVILPVLAITAWFGTPQPARRQVSLALGALAACLAVVALFFSNFGRHPEEAWALFRAAGLQIGRGTGEEHAYPWWQYLAWFARPAPVGLPWSGWLLSVGVLAAVRLIPTRPFVARVLLALALLTLFFTLLPYKTPWLTLLGWMLATWLTGAVVHSLRASFPRAAWGVVATSAVLLCLETDARARRLSVDPGNPLAYSPSSPDLARLERDLNALAPGPEAQKNLLIQVVASDYWPLPWVLRRFPQTGYWNDPTLLYPEALVLLGPEVASLQPPPLPTLNTYALRPGVFIFLRQPLR